MAENYVIAIKRQHRAEAPRDWQQQVLTVPGIEAEGASVSPERLSIQASAAGLEKVRKIIGEIAHIEPLILHTRS